MRQFICMRTFFLAYSFLSFNRRTFKRSCNFCISITKDTRDISGNETLTFICTHEKPLNDRFKGVFLPSPGNKSNHAVWRYLCKKLPPGSNSPLCSLIYAVKSSLMSSASSLCNTSLVRSRVCLCHVRWDHRSGTFFFSCSFTPCGQTESKGLVD